MTATGIFIPVVLSGTDNRGIMQRPYYPCSLGLRGCSNRQVYVLLSTIQWIRAASAEFLGSSLYCIELFGEYSSTTKPEIDPNYGNQGRIRMRRESVCLIQTFVLRKFFWSKLECIIIVQFKGQCLNISLRLAYILHTAFQETMDSPTRSKKFYMDSLPHVSPFTAQKLLLCYPQSQ